MLVIYLQIKSPKFGNSDPRNRKIMGALNCWSVLDFSHLLPKSNCFNFIKATLVLQFPTYIFL